MSATNCLTIIINLSVGRTVLHICMALQVLALRKLHFHSLNAVMLMRLTILPVSPIVGYLLCNV